MQRALKDVFDRRLKSGDLDAPLALVHAQKIWEGASRGIGKMGANPDAIGMAGQLLQNAHVFSAFKNHKQIDDLVNLLTDEQGLPRSFEEFRKAAKALTEDYNQNWLRAEYNQAIATARMAEKWIGYMQRGGKLEYVTAGDERVRKEHEEVNGTILSVLDPFWVKNYPPNGWFCRCTVRWRRGDTPDVLKGIPDNTPPEMQFNPGKKALLFDTSHPYFQRLTEATRQNIMRQIEAMKADASPIEMWRGKKGASLSIHPFAPRERMGQLVRQGLELARQESAAVQLLPRFMEQRHLPMAMGDLGVDTWAPGSLGANGLSSKLKRTKAKMLDAGMDEIGLLVMVRSNADLAELKRQLKGRNAKWLKQVWFVVQ